MNPDMTNPPSTTERSGATESTSERINDLETELSNEETKSVSDRTTPPDVHVGRSMSARTRTTSQPISVKTEEGEGIREQKMLILRQELEEAEIMARM